MQNTTRFLAHATLALGACVLAACPGASSTSDDTDSCTSGACAGSVSPAFTAGNGATGGAAASGSSNSNNSATGGRSAGSGNNNTGGTSAPNPSATGGRGGANNGTGGKGTSPSATGGQTGTTAGSSANAAGSSSANAGTNGGSAGMQAPLMNFTLVVDTPHPGDTVGDKQTVSGRAPGFLNVEVWDDMHQMPPLGHATPDANGNFTLTIDTTALTPGATTWTVYAWDSMPGQSFNHTANVPLNLTIKTPVVDPGSCSGQTCSGHGSCSVQGGNASCSCESGYHAVSLTCVADQQSTGPGQPDPGTKYVPTGYTLKFSDEFNGSSVDTGKWNTLAPFGVQFFSDSHQKQAFIPEGVTIANGLATFTAKKSSGNTNGQPYSSGSLTTNGTFTYGYFETRVSVPAGKGFWPAYWLTSSTRWPPEWDIFEIIDNVIYGYTHPVSGGKCSFVEGAAGGDSTYQIANLYGNFHIYGFKWTASDIYWYVDGVMTEHYAIDAAAGANDKFWLNVSLQVGGDWPKDPDSSTPFPSHMDVDYVRVYQQ